MSTTGGRCSRQIPDRHAATHVIRCSRKATVFVGDKGFCTQHSPEERDKRREAASRLANERFDQHLYDRLAARYCRSLGLSLDDLRMAIAKAEGTDGA